MQDSKNWRPRNYDHSYSDSVLLIDSLARSLNIATVNIGMAVGPERIIATQQKMGWNKIPIAKVPATLLGAYSISPYDVTKSYQVIANNGAKIALSTIYAITDKQGKLLYQHSTKSQQIVAAQAAFQTLHAMQQVKPMLKH